ncbi:MAG TPA: nitroreductase family protein [Bacillota bacterium]|jgi:nitroreductase|nr:nitroreductase family protein [Peptococcaceae bacterium MAG4]NLW37596.1 nitroreductase [Peptococcaceae bacterium]HPZ42575.1 nitroreductase family protein [Bacillota bacterium]HQD76780.1 nitroreductase family protein [Bacillota bacterium]HUM59661.1 nitroreductase family protein [Bacillota bacterium]
MSFMELVKKRYSVRSYKPDPVEKEKLEMVLEAARLAPTAANRQPITFIVVRTEGRKAELSRIYGRAFFTEAPLVICVCYTPKKAWTRSDGKCYGEVDATIAMDHLIMAATELGLGTCWIAAFDPKAAREVLGLPDDVEPVAFTTLGYPADKAVSKNRKPLSELVRYENW